MLAFTLVPAFVLFVALVLAFMPVRAKPEEARGRLSAPRRRTIFRP